MLMTREEKMTWRFAIGCLIHAVAYAQDEASLDLPFYKNYVPRIYVCAYVS
jgi:hypothetical protein